MSGIVVNLDLWPVSRVFIGKDISDQQMKDYCALTREMVRRREPYVSITWIRIARTKPYHRDQILSLMAEVEDDTRKYCLASAIINESPVFRFALSGIFLIRPLPMPYLIAENLVDSLAFVRTKAAAAKLVLPAEIGALTGD